MFTNTAVTSAMTSTYFRWYGG